MWKEDRRVQVWILENILIWTWDRQRESKEQGRGKQKSDDTHLIKLIKLIKILPRLNAWQHIFNLFWGANYYFPTDLVKQPACGTSVSNASLTCE